MVAKWPTWPYQVTCGSLAFDPIAVFGGGPQTPDALADFLATHNVPWHPPGQWRLAAADEETAEMVSGRLSPGELDWMRFQNQDSVWRWTGSGGCKPRSLRDGVSAGEWHLRGMTAPVPGTRVLHLAIEELSCTGGSDPTPRVQAPDVRYSRHRLIVTAWVTPLPPGGYTCPSNPAARYAVRLPRPLGKRVLLDGGTYPPERRASTLSPGARRAFPSSG